MFRKVEIAFEPGIYSNRSRRASKQRWVDGNLVRFRDGVPQQMNGWRAPPTRGVAMAGVCRDMIAWRPDDQLGRFAAIGTHTKAFRFDGATLTDITPVPFPDGRQHTIIGAGYGAGPYGDGLYGTPRLTSGLLLDASIWSFDMFGQTLLGAFNTNGAIYKYLNGTDSRLTAIGGQAPTCRAICVSDERHVFAFAADGVPGKVRWSDRESFTTWTPAAGNRAGGYTLQVASPFQCGRRVRGLILGWTQTEVFGFAPLNSALVYSRERLATEAGVAGPQSVCVVTDRTGETAYWMGIDNFYSFDGFVRELPCDLWDYVFKDLNIVQRAKFQARTNTKQNEVWFFYCGANAAEIDRAVIYNYAQNIWYKAAIARACWLDTGVFFFPLAIDPAGVIYEHETGTSANGAIMGSFITSHPIMVGVGDQFADVDQFWPDMEPLSGKCAVSFITRDYPQAPGIGVGPYDFLATDDKVDVWFSTREFQIKIEGRETLGWEMGLPLVRMQNGSLR